MRSGSRLLGPTGIPYRRSKHPSANGPHGLSPAATPYPIPLRVPLAPMIRLDNISKQNGHQIVFIEASAALQRGEKVGLVGPNGSGKTTLFRLIIGEDIPDEGQVAVDRGVTIGYFSQDVGEMAGHSAVSEVMDGAGPVSTVATELKELEA